MHRYRECYCDSCRKAGAILEALPGTEPVREPSSGTRFVLHRKDRINPVSGTEHLREHRLTPASTARRVVATCCNSPMFLDFAHGHWFSLYARRFPADSLPVVEERTMLKDMPKGFTPPPDARNSRRWSPRFFGKLFAAWAAMRFRTPGKRKLAITRERLFEGHALRRKLELVETRVVDTGAVLQRYAVLTP